MSSAGPAANKDGRPTTATGTSETVVERDSEMEIKRARCHTAALSAQDPRARVKGAIGCKREKERKH